MSTSTETPPVFGFPNQSGNDASTPVTSLLPNSLFEPPELLKKILEYNFEKWGNGKTAWMYGPRIHPITKAKQFHNGIDLGAALMTPILALWGGVVLAVWTDDMNGNAMRIGHSPTLPGFEGVSETGYAHMHQFGPHIAKGTRVDPGQVIGYVGSTGASTGPHLHYVTRVALASGVLATVDPLPFLARRCGMAEIPTHHFPG